MSEEALHIDSDSPERTQAVGAAVGRLAKAGDVIALVGELGAGKTQFVRGLAAGLGIDPRVVSSPTFVLVQEYEPEAGEGPVLVHIDAYRLSGADDLASIGWEREGEELRRGAVVAVEWADLVAAGLGESRLDVTLGHAGRGRWLSLSPHGDWRPRMKALRDAVERIATNEDG